ncbi:MAG TPA: hypothetical protein VH083_07850 [Myxococcales bacterium]|jgi:hypothetical protein|nr:hypothetical protein [Myxococcales bacterium]
MGALLTFGSGMTCAHGGLAIAIPAPLPPRLFARGVPVLTMANQVVIPACPVMAVPKSNQLSGAQYTVVAPFCVQAASVLGASRVSSQGAPVLLADSQVMAVPSNAPLLLTPSQFRVQGQ